ncbi:hypothetical protein OCHUTO_0425 [Orientia chuto str. Dubai]|uniref:Uncharacterized protein n=1 Tax=Orientia chuto str. Dubai TaxID=1359168 RepID=A0A0F3MLC0_9RICK|nr:hypothetical protein [Candidatus Orientia mediorientalis]KJV56540.1 hypothetical protein OCHUTO_0425 [Orientia chuto str. Dubai]
MVNTMESDINNNIEELLQNLKSLQSDYKEVKDQLNQTVQQIETDGNKENLLQSLRSEYNNLEKLVSQLLQVTAEVTSSVKELQPSNELASIILQQIDFNAMCDIISASKVITEQVEELLYEPIASRQDSIESEQSQVSMLSLSSLDIDSNDDNPNIDFQNFISKLEKFSDI